jgi:protein SCO1/2
MKSTEDRERGHDVLPERRRFLAGAGACFVLGAAPMAAAHGIGIVKPSLPLPAAVSVLCSDGRRVQLRQILMGQTTAVQLMFTGCSETCPLQGALFASVQDQLAKSGIRLQLLSLSIDPMDDARSLTGWLRRFGAGGRWLAAVPAAQDIEILRDALRAGAATKTAHSAQVYFVDQQARLVWRSEDFPSSEVVVAIARQLSGQTS